MKKNIFLKNELLRILFSSSNHTLQAFTLNKRLSVAPNVFFDVIFQLEKEELLVVDGVFIKLSNLGEKKVLLDLNASKNSKNNIPKKFLSESKLKVNDLYIPKRSLL